MNKSSLITFLLAMASAFLVLFALGIFDSAPTSTPTPVVPVNTLPPEAVSQANEATIPTQWAPTPTQTQAPKPSMAKTLTSADVARHSSASDCWVIISNNVYNLTAYIPYHPGGQSVIIRACGGDGTTVFMQERKHSRPSVQAELATYLLGALQR